MLQERDEASTRARGGRTTAFGAKPPATAWIIALLFRRPNKRPSGRPAGPRVNDNSRISTPSSSRSPTETIGYWLDSAIYSGLAVGVNMTGIIDDMRRSSSPNAGPAEDVLFRAEFLQSLVPRERWQNVQAVRGGPPRAALAARRSKRRSTVKLIVAPRRRPDAELLAEGGLVFCECACERLPPPARPTDPRTAPSAAVTRRTLPRLIWPVIAENGTLVPKNGFAPWCSATPVTAFPEIRLERSCSATGPLRRAVALSTLTHPSNQDTHT
jgi:hypothetical protein